MSKRKTANNGPSGRRVTDAARSGIRRLSSRSGLIAAIVAAAVVVVAVGVLWKHGRPDSGSAQPATRANLLLVTIDTFRADRVGRGVTPTIDALASRGLSFTNARTVAPLTLPAHVSLMTGLFPPAHGVRENGTYRFDGKHPTLARLLHEAGYATAAFVGAYVLDRRFGLDAGFDTYDDQIPRDPDAVGRLDAERRGDLVANRAIAWLREMAQVSQGGRVGESSRPFFLWVHLYDPHAPYQPPAAFLEKAHGQAYDGEVAFADAQIHRVLAALDERSLTAKTIVVVAGDHGESLGEHGEQTHGMLLFEAALRVPLVIAGPGIAPALRTTPVSLVDVAPSLLRLLGQPTAPGMSAANLATGEAGAASSDVYSETQYPRTAGWSPVFSLVEDRWKLIEASGPKLFDVKADPAEQHDVARLHEGVVRSMAARIAEVRAKATGNDTQQRPAADVAERLRSLGYVAATNDRVADSNAPDPATEIAAWTSFDEALNLLAARRFPPAIEILQRLVASHPHARVFESSYVQALQESGNAAEAVRVARGAVARHPDDPALFHALAVAARDAHRLDEALRAERAALELDPGDPAAHNGLGLVCVDLQRTGDAVAAFERATALDPTNAQYWTNLGNARRDAGSMTGADEAYRRALAIDDRESDAANGLGVLLVQSGRPADAIPWFERALANTNGFYEAWLNLGIACDQAGDTERAAQAYREVLRAPARFAREREGASRMLANLERGRGR